MGSEQNKIEKAIIDKALELGASTAGLASIRALKEAPSYKAYTKSPFYEQFDHDDPNYQEFKGFNWREEHKTALVWALEHPVSLASS